MSNFPAEVKKAFEDGYARYFAGRKSPSLNKLKVTVKNKEGVSVLQASAQVLFQTVVVKEPLQSVLNLKEEARELGRLMAVKAKEVAR